MYNRDSITILVREAPGVEEPSKETMETIRKEFNRIFGDQQEAGENKDEKDSGEDEKFLKENEEEAGEEKDEKDSGAEKDEKDSGAEKDEKDSGAEEKKPDNDEEVEKNTGADEEEPDAEEEGAGAGKSHFNQPKIQGKPLNFDTDLKADDHKGCDKGDSYPDLSMSLIQRNKLQEDNRRSSRQANTERP